MFRAEKIDTHGGSIRVYISKDKNKKVEKNIKDLIEKEEKFGIKNFKTYQNFGKKVYEIRENVVKNINNLKKNNDSIIGYGAPAKATTALNFFGISNQIDYIIEDNKLKHKKFIPGVKIPIYSKDKILKKKPLVLVLAWNFFEFIKKSNKGLAKKFVSFRELQK